MSLLKKPSVSRKAKRKLADISTGAVESDSSSSSSSLSASRSASSDSDSDSGSGSGPETDSSPAQEFEGVTDEPDVPVLSHAERRRQKKRKLNSGDAAPSDVSGPPTSSEPKKGKDKKKRKSGEVSEGGSALPRRQNSVWVGNLAYKTTAVALKAFFEGLEVTRIHMPLKAPPTGAGPKVNSGFAYVDFATPDAKLVAITMSERNLDGRRLLIKDGDDFAGRPTAATMAATAVNEDGTAASTDATTLKPGAPRTGLTKIAQKILAAQKQPPGQTLFFGNLGFEATEDSIRQLLEAHRKKPADTLAGNDGDHSEGDEEEHDEKAESGVKGSQKVDKWIRKIRMGTFEDSGKCKGWAFVDFTSTEHATAALINPRNHSLDGRQLKVEYASPDAVRRGGGPRGSGNEPNGEGGATNRSGVRKPRSAGYIRNKPKSAAGRFTKDGEKKLNKKERKVEKKTRKMEKQLGHRLDAERASTGKGERPKPGASLALAQRGTAAILPSQGQKITF